MIVFLIPSSLPIFLQEATCKLIFVYLIPFSSQSCYYLNVLGDKNVIFKLFLYFSSFRHLFSSDSCIFQPRIKFNPTYFYFLSILFYNIWLHSLVPPAPVIWRRPLSLVLLSPVGCTRVSPLHNKTAVKLRYFRRCSPRCSLFTFVPFFTHYACL